MREDTSQERQAKVPGSSRDPLAPRLEELDRDRGRKKSPEGEMGLPQSCPVCSLTRGKCLPRSYLPREGETELCVPRFLNHLGWEPFPMLNLNRSTGVLTSTAIVPSSFLPLRSLITQCLQHLPAQNQLPGGDGEAGKGDLHSS